MKNCPIILSKKTICKIVIPLVFILFVFLFPPPAFCSFFGFHDNYTRYLFSIRYPIYQHEANVCLERFEIEKNTGSLEKQWNGYACKVSPISWFLVNNPLVDDYKNRKVVFFQTYVSFLSNMGGFIYCDKCELKEGDIANASLIYNIIYLKDNWYFVQMT